MSRMGFGVSNLLKNFLVQDKWIEPEVTPVSMRDVDMAKGEFDMCLPMADPCPNCGAFNMQIGDYVCMGFCCKCTSDIIESEG